MKTFAIIMHNAVTNIIVADNEETALSVSHEGSLAVECDVSTLVGTDWTYDGTKLVPPTIQEPTDDQSM
jgi:hypothetical protein